MPQCAVGFATDADVSHPEEARLVKLAAVQLLEHVPRVWPLNLEAERLLRPITVQLALVPVAGHVERPEGGVVFDPARHGRSPDDVHQGLPQTHQDHVADDVAIGGTTDKLLRLAVAETVEPVDPQACDEGNDIGAFDVEVGHVERLVHQRHALPPCSLLVAPVGELGRDRKLVGPHAGAAKHLQRGRVLIEFLLKRGHGNPPVLVLFHGQT